MERKIIKVGSYALMHVFLCIMYAYILHIFIPILCTYVCVILLINLITRIIFMKKKINTYNRYKSLSFSKWKYKWMTNHAESWFHEPYIFITFMEKFVWSNIYLIQRENIKYYALQTKWKRKMYNFLMHLKNFKTLLIQFCFD